MPFNPKSLENLGKPKTKVGILKFRLTAQAIEYLAKFKNKTAEIERLIEQEINRQRTENNATN